MKLLAIFVVLVTASFLGVCPVQAFLFAPASGHFRQNTGRFNNLRRQRPDGRPSFQAALCRGALRHVTSTVFMMEAPKEIECEVAIVGGGPAGCTCALYTARADHHTVVIDKSPAIGALARTNVIANYPGVDKEMNGQDLLDAMREQAIYYGTEYHRAQVFLVDADDSGIKTIYTPDFIFKAKALVLATGAMGREPYFKGEDKYLGQGVSYCATCDGAFYRDSEVAVVGVNPEAIEEAEFLTKFASTVHWITQKDPLPTDEDAQDLLAKPNVKQWRNTRMESIEGDANGVTGVKVKPRDEESQVLPVEGVFIYISGSKPITEFCEGAVEFNADGGVKTDDEMQTSLPGVYAIGDIRNTPFKQAVVAASDGCIAAMSIDKYLKGRKKIKVDWIHQ